MQTLSVATNLSADDPILRMPDVEHSVGLRKSTIYAMVKEGDFPPPINLGRRASGWLLSDINQWKRERIAASRPQAMGVE